jgi:hypothetical protein
MASLTTLGYARRILRGELNLPAGCLRHEDNSKPPRQSRTVEDRADPFLVCQEPLSPYEILVAAEEGLL